MSLLKYIGFLKNIDLCKFGINLKKKNGIFDEKIGLYLFIQIVIVY